MRLTRFRGDNKDIVITITDDTGTALDLTGCTSFVLTADPSKAPIDSVNNLFALAGSIISAAAGSVGFAISTVQADHVGLFYYDVAYIDADGKVCTAGVDTLKFVQDIGKDFLTDNVPAETPLTSLAYIDQAVIDAQAAAAAADLDAQATAADRIQTGLDVLAAEASAIPDIGEIRYFSTAPTGLGWMACDGAPYLRTAYPDYEGMRPKSAFKHTLIYQSATNSGPGGFSCWTGQYFLSCGVASYDRSIYRSTDLVNWTSVSNALPAGYGGPDHNLYSFGTTGRVLALDRLLGKCVVSLDHGATWNTADNIALPTTTPQAGVMPFWSLPKLMSTGKVITFLMEADIAATSSDGVTWSKVQLPFHARWECIHDMYLADSDVFAADPSQPGKFIGIWENAYYGQWHDLPHVGLFNDWRGTNDATGSTYYVSMSNRQKQLFFASNDGTYMQKQILYDTPINEGQLGGTGFVNGRFIARAGRDLFIFDPNTVECEYIKDFFGVPTINTYFGTCVPKDGTMYMFIGGSQPEITSITVDPLKFNAPGLAPKAGATPYVYTGA